jgi:hypothetical protein
MCSSGTCSDCERARKDKETGHRIVGGYIGFWSGMAAGAAAGSVIPVIGTVPGAIAGATLGAIGGAGDKTATDNARSAVGAIPRLLGWWNS